MAAETRAACEELHILDMRVNHSEQFDKSFLLKSNRHLDFLYKLKKQKLWLNIWSAVEFI